MEKTKRHSKKNKTMNKLLVCTQSGGRTSGFMDKFLLEYEKYKNYDKLFVFLNTGKELEQTLEFVNRCDQEWSLNTVWIEAKINKEKGKGTDFKIVDFETASRNGEPFEEMLKAYPLPNTFVSNCTRELKQVPMEKYIKSLGYKDVYTAMGIRYDERHRISNTYKKQRLLYPLIYDIQVDNSFIRKWWDDQPFDLKLKDYESNCDLCFKKSERKRMTILKESPGLGEWWDKMEKQYGTDDYPRFDLRKKITVEQLIKNSKMKFSSIRDIHELSKEQFNLFDDSISDYETDCFCKAT